MRAWDAILFLALFGAVMGIFDNSLSDGFLNNTHIDTGTVINPDDFDDMTSMGTNDDSTLDVFAMSAKMLWTATVLLFKMLVRIVIIFDIVYNIFGGGPAAAAVAAIVQVSIWAIYSIGFYQLKSNTSIEGMA